MPQAPMLTTEETASLIEELADALERMVDQSCADMGPLWLEATRRARAQLGEARIPSLGWQPSPRYIALSKGAKSRYRGLAAWRHAALWCGVLKQIDDPTFRLATQTVYFTPYPANTTPYAWSGRASSAPGVERFDSPTSMKHQAKEGCHQSVQLLRDLRHDLERDGTWEGTVRADLLQPGTRDSLRDVLKLEDHPPWEKK